MWHHYFRQLIINKEEILSKKEDYKSLCKWCKRYDCEEKGGDVKRCPVDRDEPIAVEDMFKFNREQRHG